MMSDRPRDVADIKVEHGESFEVTSGSYVLDESGRAHRNEPTRKFTDDEVWINTSYDPSRDSAEAKIASLEARVSALEERLR